MDSLPSVKVKVKMGSLPSGEQCIAMMGPGDLLSSNFPEGINGERQVLKSCHWRKRNLIRSHHGKKNQINWLSLSFWGWRKTPLLYVNVTCVYIPVELQLKDKRLCWITATRKVDIAAMPTRWVQSGPVSLKIQSILKTFLIKNKKWFKCHKNLLSEIFLMGDYKEKS